MLDQSAVKTKTQAGPDAHAQALLAWYDVHRRALPWRALPGLRADPYAVWLSEVMLQQTTVAAVKAYYLRFLERWPTVGALAAAPVEAVMREWAGLGYYSRARNLHACARAVAQVFGGRFPRREADLLQLPGVGPYTAAAIAAIAFDEKTAVVDGNVERVIARLFAVEAAIPAARPAIRQHAAALTPDARPGDYAQAMMDLGAIICTPRKPACALCPLAAGCMARQLGQAEQFPRKAAKTERPRRFGAVFYVRRADGMVLLRTRPPRGLLGGMAEFPGTEWGALAVPDPRAQTPLTASWRLAQDRVRHVFTHFALELEVWVAQVAADTAAPANCRWVAVAGLDREALPTLMRKAAAAAAGAKLERRRG